jgi:uncharacterized protein YdcH (DUF465 family)
MAKYAITKKIGSGTITPQSQTYVYVEFHEAQINRVKYYISARVFLRDGFWKLGERPGDEVSSLYMKRTDDKPWTWTSRNALREAIPGWVSEWAAEFPELLYEAGQDECDSKIQDLREKQDELDAQIASIEAQIAALTVKKARMVKKKAMKTEKETVK